MINEKDEANLMGQVAGIIAALSALIDALPPATCKRLQRQLDARFDSLLAGMRSSGAGEGTAECEGAQWVRELLVRQLAETKPKAKDRKAASRQPGGFDIEL
jgi:hypothetical protein